MRTNFPVASHHEVKNTFEELGKRQSACLEVRIAVDCEPEERQSWDHPGSPDTVEVTGVTVTEYSNESIVVKRAERPDWFKWLDRVALKYVDHDEVVDRLNDQFC